jgi:hypothetical protein
VGPVAKGPAFEALAQQQRDAENMAKARKRRAAEVADRAEALVRKDAAASAAVPSGFRQVNLKKQRQV